MIMGINKKNYLIDKNALKLIKLMMPLGHLALFLQDILDEKPPQNVLLIFILYKFKEFLTFAHKILFLDSNLVNIPELNK